MLLPPAAQPLDPYPFYADKRRHQPIAHDPEDDTWAVYRFDDVRSVVKDFARFSSDPDLLETPIPGADEVRSRSLIRLDPPDHRRIRSMVAPSFTPAGMAKLGPTIASLAHTLLDQVAPSGHMDVIADLAFPLPVTVIAELLGIPTSDRGMYKQWADKLLGRGRTRKITDGLPPEARQVFHEMDAYFADIIRHREKHPKDDLISQWVTQSGTGRATQDELISLSTLLLLAGHVTTVNLIGNAVWSLLDWPDQLQRLRREPYLIPMAVEEVLRYRSPVQTVSRITNGDVTIGETTIPNGRLVMAWIGSANRDERMFPDPDRFDVGRNPREQLGFGSGIHVCLGAPLARLEGQVVLKALIDRLDEWHWTPGSTLQPSKQQVLFGLEQLPLSFQAGQRRAA